MEPATTLRPALLGKPIASYRAMPLPPATWMLWVALWATLLTASLFNDHLNLQFFYWMALLGTAATCWTARRRMHSRLDLYQNGFDLRHGKRHRRVCWNQIYEVYQVPIYGCLTRVDGQAVPASWIVHIIRRDGRCLRLAGFEAMQRLGSHIQHSLSERQLRVAVDAYRAGYTVRFGRHFAVGHDGIYVRHQRMAWDDIAEISIDDADSIRLTPQQITTDSLHIESSLVPNLPVLHEFLQMTQQPDFHGHAT